MRTSVYAEREGEMGALEFSISPDILFSSVCLHFTVGHPLLFMLYCY